jgi:uncharacterized protein YdaT
MPWDEKNYPDSMGHLPPLARRKAVETANALEAGRDEGSAIRIAIVRATERARRRGLR